MSQTWDQAGWANVFQRPRPSLDMVIPVIRANRSPAPDGTEDAVVDLLAGSLVVLYAFDHRDQAPAVTHRELETLGVDRDGLSAAAQENLIDRMADLEILERPDGCGMLRLDGALEASALVVTQLWCDISGILADQVVVAVPAWDTVLFCAAGVMAHRRALVSARNRALAVSNHTLTSELFRFDDGGTWQPEAS